MVCLDCQSIQDAEDIIGDQKISIPEKHGFQVVRQQVVLQGYCPGCKQNSGHSQS
jgi:Fe2+ or Zn2+ uptake regulation protein